MATKIESKIVSYKVLTPEDKEQKLQKAAIIEPPSPTMNFDIERDGVLVGKTYKIKPTVSGSSYYITLNSQVVGGKAYPREIFISSKNVEHFEYLATITRLISAIFRRGGDVSFIVEELYAIHNPKGGYWGKDRKTGKGKYYNSILGEIGAVIQEFLDDLVEVTEVATSYIAPENQVWVDDCTGSTPTGLTEVILDTQVEELGYVEPENYPDSATVCPNCHVKACVLLDGCSTCLECGHSKCS